MISGYYVFRYKGWIHLQPKLFAAPFARQLIACVACKRLKGIWAQEKRFPCTFLRHNSFQAPDTQSRMLQIRPKKGGYKAFSSPSSRQRGLIYAQ